MDLLTSADIAALAEPGQGGLNISLFMPTHRFGRGVDADRLRFKNLVAGVEASLGKRMKQAEIDDLLAPAHQLRDDAMEWQYMSDGLAMFLSKDRQRTFRVAAPMPTLATVGDKAVLGPMLRLLSGDGAFLVLALSQREIRLMEGSRNTVEDLQLTDVPTSSKDASIPRDPRSDTMARPAASAGRGSSAVFYGHGAGDRHVKDIEVQQFLRSVSTGLKDILAGQTIPMVLVGLEHLVTAYREVNTYSNVIDEAIEHNPDQLSKDELHKMAWPLIESRLRAERARVIGRFQELNGTGRVSGDLRTILEAATAGRVETLFVKADPWCWERATDEDAPVVELGADERFADCELVDAAAVATLHTNGLIFATSQTVAPNSEVAAILRY
ncbi:hypothetical protein AAFM46_15495 [Arthrobacter sp. TMP15]|uniref:baeRF3 domain-containing protein n=1 Tax=Arthrobacter sp. TMP15 TaxID=3140789 RepID=UPI0031BB49F4